MTLADYQYPSLIGLTSQQITDIAESCSDSFDFKVGDSLEPMILRLGGKLHPHGLRSKEVKSERIAMLVHDYADFEIYSPETQQDADNFRVFLAMLIGYYCLHYLFNKKVLGRPISGLKVQSVGEPASHNEAAVFAREILVPRKDLIARWDKMDGDSKRLATLYAVPVKMVESVDIDAVRALFDAESSRSLGNESSHQQILHHHTS